MAGVSVAAACPASLGLRLQAEGGRLMLYRRDTGARLLTAEEAQRVEAEARRAAEAEVAGLREELRRRTT